MCIKEDNIMGIGRTRVVNRGNILRYHVVVAVKKQCGSRTGAPRWLPGTRRRRSEASSRLR
jgi:hypothetical protein